MHNYTVCQKETRHSIIGHNFGKFGQILKINGSFWKKYCIYSSYFHHTLSAL